LVVNKELALSKVQVLGFRVSEGTVAGDVREICLLSIAVACLRVQGFGIRVLGFGFEV